MSIFFNKKKSLAGKNSTVKTVINTLSSNFLSPNEDYVSFITSRDFESLLQMKNLLSKENGINKISQRELLTKLNEVIKLANLYEDLLDKSKVLSEKREALKQEIEEYSIAVEEARLKNRLSADWNGKKQPLMVLGQKLNFRREEFLEEEQVLKGKISLFYRDYNQLCTDLQGFILE